MTPLERLWMLGVSFVAGLALVIACATAANAQQPARDPDVLAHFSQVLFEARNRCEGDLAKMRAEVERLTRELTETKAKLPKETPTK